MDKIIVKGKLNKDFECDTCMQPQEESKEATIEILPPSQEEISKLKEGDEVLVKYRLFKTFSGELEINCHSINLCDIIAILSQPQQEFCKCKKSSDPFNRGLCALCSKPIHPEPKFNPQSMDAKVWAKEFIRLYKNSRLAPINIPDWLDEELMLGWFANAIMAGFDEANRRNSKSESKKEIEELDLHYPMTLADQQELEDKLNELIQAFNSRKG